MVRLKFLVFALVALAVAALQLYVVSPSVGGPAEALATESARSAALAARGEVIRQKQALEAFALDARTAAPVLEVLGRPATARASMTTEERLELLREPVLSVLPEEQRGEVTLWLAEEGGGAKATAAAAATTADPAEVAGLAALPVGALVHTVADAPHLVTSIPLSPLLGTLVMAVPLSPSVLEPVAPKAGQVGVALLMEGKVIASAGPVAAAELEGALSTVKVGSGAVVARASSGKLGPVGLPALTGKPAEQTAQRVGFRVEAGEGLEAAAVVELSPLQGALATGQRTGLMALGGLALLALVWTALMGGGAKKREEESGDGSELRASLSVLPLTPMPISNPAPAVRATEGGAAEEPTPGPDDFQFPPSPESSTSVDDAAQALAAGGGGRSASSFGFTPSPPSADVAFTPAPPAALETALSPEPAPAPIAESAPTPVPQAASFAPAQPSYGLPPPVAAPKPVDPFGMVSQGSTHDSYYGDDNPDATRVAAVPKELLQASASSMPSTTASVVSRPLGFVPAVAAPAADPDEEHFHAVFNDFVSTRASCGEPADGVTYEKFALKLRKNRDQLVQKYACRTVRFQVYVKEGKAALKATPVKD